MYVVCDQAELVGKPTLPLLWLSHEQLVQQVEDAEQASFLFDGYCHIF